jgi:hypothetical protein
LVAFGITQSRFYYAYFKRYGGGTTAWERQWMWLRHPLQYLRLLRKPPYTPGSIFRRLDDPMVEQRRRQYALAAIAIFAYPPALFVGLVVGLIVYGTPVVR